MVLGDEKTMAVVGKLVGAQATVFAEASLSPIARRAAREGAMEAVTGSYVSLPCLPLSCNDHRCNFSMSETRCTMEMLSSLRR